MRKIGFLLSFLLLCTLAMAQTQDPVRWAFAAQKKSATEYLVTITATLPQPWHIYSQRTPAGGPIPTAFSFAKNPLLTTTGKATETGKLKKIHDKNFDVDVLYYADKVVFSQLVKLKAPVKTNLSGSVEYMVCNDEMCLPPAKQKFSIPLM